MGACDHVQKIRPFSWELISCWGSIRMYMHSLFRPLLLLFCFLVASSSFAANPYRLEVSGAYFTSRAAACDSAWTYTDYASQSKWKLISSSYNMLSDYRGYCAFNIQNLEDGRSYYGQGASCGSSSCYFTTEPACVSGESKTLSWAMGRSLPNDGYQDFGTIYPATACFSGCNATYGGSGSEPYTVPGSDSSDIVYIDASYTLDGSTCSASTASPDAPDIPPAPEPEPEPEPDPEPESDPCVTDPASCEPTGGDTGGSTGGDTGGSTGGDTGGSTGGDTGGSTGGDTGGSTGGDTGGSTGGDTGGSTGSDTTDSSVSGLACDQPVVCSGDAVQCAILAQQKSQRCLDAANSDYPAQEDAIKSLVSGPEFELDKTDIEAPSLFDQHGRFLSGSCPPPESFHMNHGGGQTLQFSYEPICRLADDLSWVIVAFATLSAALYIGRSFGGG